MVLVAIACSYLCSLPLAIILTFVINKGVYGLWLGFYAGVALQLLLLVQITVISANWRQCAIKLVKAKSNRDSVDTRSPFEDDDDGERKSDGS